MIKYLVKGAVYDTTPLSRFIVPTILQFSHGISDVSHFVFFIPLLDFSSLFFNNFTDCSQSPFLPSCRFYLLPLFLTSASTACRTPHLTIQTTSWRYIVQGSLLYSSLYYLLPSLVVSLPCCPYCIPPRIPLMHLLHFSDSLSFPKCLLLLWTPSIIPRTYPSLVPSFCSVSFQPPIPPLLRPLQVVVSLFFGHLLDLCTALSD